MNPTPNQIDPLDAAADSPVEAVLQYEPHVKQPSTEIDFRLERSNRLKLSILSSLLIKPLAFVIPIITVPLFLKYLGEEGFGLYAAVGAMVLWVGVLNLGLNLGLINLLTECSVSEDRVMARRYVSTLTIAMTGMLFAGSFIYTVIVLAVDWRAVFPTSDPLVSRQTPWVVWFAGIGILLGVVSGIPAAIYAGYQEIHRWNVWDGVAKIVLLLSSLSLMCLPMSWLRSWGIIAVIVATAGVPSLVRFANVVDMFWREKPWLRPSLQIFDWEALKVMLRQGLALFVLSTSVIALFQSDKLIIGVGIEPAAVTAYEVLGRLFLSAYGVFMLVLSPLWPAYGDAIRRGDLPWVKRQLTRTRIVGTGSMFLMGVVVLLFGNQIIHLWTRGQQINVSNSLILAVASLFIVRAWTDTNSVPLNAAGVLLPQVIVYGSHALLNLVVAIFVVRRWGSVEGVAWTTSITGLFTTVWGYPWMVRKYLTHREQGNRITDPAM